MLKVSIIGNLGNDPELKYSQSGSPILRCNVASNYRSKNQEGEWEDKTEWVRVTVFGARAESLANYLKKGSRIFADGRLEARPWTANDGSIRAGLEMIGETIEFMSSRNDDAGNQRPAARQESGNDSDLPF